MVEVASKEGAGPEWWSRGDGDTDGGRVMVAGSACLLISKVRNFSVLRVAWRELAW